MLSVIDSNGIADIGELYAVPRVIGLGPHNHTRLIRRGREQAVNHAARHVPADRHEVGNEPLARRRRQARFQDAAVVQITPSGEPGLG